MLYKSYLIRRTELIKFWSFFGFDFKYIFRINYKFLYLFYNKFCFIKFKLLVKYIYKLIPLFLNLQNKNGNILYVLTKAIYSQTIISNFYFPYRKELFLSSNIAYKKFSIKKKVDYNFWNWNFLDNWKKKPSFIFFWCKKNNLVIESKKKNIPIISIIKINENSQLIDFPIFVNHFSFYLLYFFNKFLYKLLVK